MSVQPLRLAPLHIPGYAVKKSGIVWLYPDGAWCAENQIIAFCNINLENLAGGKDNPFAKETVLQAALAAPAAGRLRADPETSFGGYLDFLGVQAWNADAIIGFLETDEDATPVPLPMRNCMLTGKLLTGLANFGTGLLPGWHTETRAWRQDSPCLPKTLLSLAMCDARGPLRGDQEAFIELFEASQTQCHIVVASNDLLVPNAIYLREQFERDKSAFNLIAYDIEQAIFNGPVKPTPQDHFFVGLLLDSLRTSPIRETHDIITGAGLQKTSLPAAIILSANAEQMHILRHKTLAYHLQIYHFQFAAAGPATKAWLLASFEHVARTIASIKNDYENLFNAVLGEVDAKFMILNRMSSSGREDLAFYAPFDTPLAQTLAHIAAKEINLMLHELTATYPIDIIDIDSIAAEIGGAQHLPDGVHQSGEMQSRIRAKIIRLIP